MTTSPIEAAKIATVVIQPRTLSQKLFTLWPMILRLLVINMISNSNGGVENPLPTIFSIVFVVFARSLWRI